MAVVDSGAGMNSRHHHHADEAAASRMRRVDASALQRLKTRDNRTNIRHLAFVWTVIAFAIGGAIAFEHWLIASGHSAWWNLPVVVAAIITVGASQHQLGGAIHEGTHYMLFANRRLNELASDWFAAFPIYTSTYQFRVHHLAHHQFVNDPDRDPDISQLRESNHWLDFPVAHVDLLRKLAAQMWLPNLIRYTVIRAKYSAIGFDHNPYRDDSVTPSIWPTRAGILFAVGAPAVVAPLVVLGFGYWALAALAAAYLAVVVYYARLPADRFAGTQLQPVVSHRATAIGRISFMALVYAGVSVTQIATGAPAWAYYGLYWIVPLFTGFPLFMVLRQWVQHGNADRGRYTNTRVFLVNPVIRYAVFPWGMDFHLPHHLYASVPHYHLRELHETLLADPEYREKGVIVEGYFGGDDTASGRPTAMSVIGPAHARKHHEAVHIDDDALEHAEVKDPAAIAREAAASRLQS